MAGIASSIIQAFLQHQFAKERMEQENRMMQERQQKAQEAQMQQALQMREIIGDQMKQRLEAQVADRQARHQETLAQREHSLKTNEMLRRDALAQAKMLAEMRLKETAQGREQSREDARMRGEDILKRQKEMADYRRKLTTPEREAAQGIRRAGLEIKLGPVKDKIAAMENGLFLLDRLEGAYGYLAKNYPGVLPKGATKIDSWIASAKKQTRLVGDEKAATALTTIEQWWNPFVIGVLDRGTYDEKGVRALQVFSPQLRASDLLPASGARAFFTDARSILKGQHGRYKDRLGDIMTQFQGVAPEAEPEETE